MAIKKFQDIRVGDQLFYISPTLLEIQPVTVVFNEVVRSKSGQNVMRRIKVIRNMQYKSKLITDKEMITALDQEGTNIFLDILLPPKECLATLLQETPTVICTDKLMLARWMGQR